MWYTLKDKSKAGYEFFFLHAPSNNMKDAFTQRSGQKTARL